MEASRQKQCALVRRAMEAPLRGGDLYYVLSTKWFSSWRRYVGFDGSEEDDVEPGPISNEPLCESHGFLRSDLVEQDDYSLVPEKVWKSLEAWYGGGPSFARRVVGSDEPQIEVHLLRFEVRRVRESDGAPGAKSKVVEVSRSETVGKVRARLAKAANVEEESTCRVWLKPAERDQVTSNSKLAEESFWKRLASSSAEEDLDDDDDDDDDDADPVSEEARERRERNADGALSDLDSWVELDATKGDELLGASEAMSSAADALRWGALAETPCTSDEKARRQLEYPRDMLRERWRGNLKKGDLIDARDSEGRWFDSVVTEVSTEKIKVHYRGWSSKWDAWVSRYDLKSIQPLFTKTDDWRANLRPDDACEVRCEDEKKALWYEAQVVAFHPKEKDSDEDHVSVKIMTQQQSNGAAANAQPRHLPTSSEHLCKLGTHIKKGRSVQAQQPTSNSSSSTSLVLTTQKNGSDRALPGWNALEASSKGASSSSKGASSYGSSSRAAAGTSLFDRSSGRSHHRGAPPSPGAVGLSNLGNTCFMNSMLQCLSHTAPLTDYFRDSERVAAELNCDNPLGSGGQIAKAYADFIRDAWSGDFSVVVPAALKRAIGKHAPQFGGYQQQDSQELMSFLLDGLHEDLNRVRQKPYLETIESNGRPDEEVAEESWKRHQMRNQSIVVDTCYGQLRSHITCPNCNHESITFDPYLSLSLPLPSATKRHVGVTLSKLDGSRPTKFVVALEGRDSIAHLKDGLAALAFRDGLTTSGSHVTRADLDICDIWAHRISRSFGDHNSIEQIKSSDELIAFELAPNEANDSSSGDDDGETNTKEATTTDDDENDDDASKKKSVGTEKKTTKKKKSSPSPQDAKRLTVDVFFGRQSERGAQLAAITARNAASRDAASSLKQQSAAQQRFELFGAPFRLAFDGTTTCGAIRNAIETRVKRIVKKRPENKDDDAADDQNAAAVDDQNASSSKKNKNKLVYRICVSAAAGTKFAQELPDDETPIAEVLETGQALTLDWSAEAIRLYYDRSEHEAVDLDETAKKRANLSGKGTGDRIDISDCFRSLAEREQLGDTEQWYCSKCKQHSRAYKKLDLWSTPEILILHLKRFQYAQNMYVISSSPL